MKTKNQIKLLNVKVVRLLLTAFLFATSTNVFAKKVFEGDTTISGSFNVDLVESPVVIKGDFYMGDEAKIWILAGGELIITGNLYASNKITIDLNGKIAVGGDLIVSPTIGLTVKGTALISKNCFFYVIGNMDMNSFTSKYIKSGGETELAEKHPGLMEKLQEHSKPVEVPTTLIAFNVYAHDGYNELVWSTSSELNVDRFRIYKSEDGVNWNPLVQTPSANGTSTSTSEYSEIDDVIEYSKTFYKLAFVNTSEEETTLTIIDIENDIETGSGDGNGEGNGDGNGDGNGSDVETSIDELEDFFFNSNEKQTIIVSSVDGKILYKDAFDGTEESYNEVIKSLPKGVYILTLQSDYKVVSEKIAK